MNERIKELESQCWEPRKYGPDWFNSEKFAELILKQCLSYIDDSFGDVDYVKFMINRDFGVKDE